MKPKRKRITGVYRGRKDRKRQPLGIERPASPGGSESLTGEYIGRVPSIEITDPKTGGPVTYRDMQTGEQKTLEFKGPMRLSTKRIGD